VNKSETIQGLRDSFVFFKLLLAKMTRLSSFVTHVRKLFQIMHLSSQWYTYNRITLDDLLPVWVDATRANLLSFLLSSAKYFKGNDKEDHELEEGDHQARKGNQN